MLRNLIIRDFALVRALEIDFERGLTVLTGESGAGKSILLGALGMVVGDRADTNNIRPGAERCEVAAEFHLDGNGKALALLTERDLIDTESQERCLLRRVLTREGRSRAFVNGSPVTRQELATLTAELIDIHSQNEHQSLLRRDVQLALLDDFARHAKLTTTVRTAFRDWQRSRLQLSELRERLDKADDRAALLDYQVGELDELALAEGEFEELDSRFRRLARSQDTEAQIAGALAVLDAEQETGVAQLQQIARHLGAIRDDHPALEAARELITSALAQLDDSAGELRQYLDALQSDPGELAQLEARVDVVMSLARKHRVRPEALPALHTELAAELNALAVDRSQLGELEQRTQVLLDEFRAEAAKLTKSRRKAARQFERDISEHMERLGIAGGRLELKFIEQESETGFESVEYLVVTNPKYPAAALARIASGGERSRISLAIQVVAAARSRLPTLVLDEADVGIGGTTADVVGRLLRTIAGQSQVLCVTHAPQVAALGEHHLTVEKDDQQDTRISVLDANARVTELARMLGGRDITAKTREYARELIAAGAATTV